MNGKKAKAIRRAVKELKKTVAENEPMRLHSVPTATGKLRLLDTLEYPTNSERRIYQDSKKAN